MVNKHEGFLSILPTNPQERDGPGTLVGPGGV